jgi:hypothetical protein
MDYRTETTRVLMRIPSYRTGLYWLATPDLLESGYMYRYERETEELTKRETALRWRPEEFTDPLTLLREDEQWVILAVLFGD